MAQEVVAFIPAGIVVGIEKIIRKGKKYQERNISVLNYKEIVTDLIGIRVLHLFKDDWQNRGEKYKPLRLNFCKLWDAIKKNDVNKHRNYKQKH